jgi:hypothetical protein
MAPVRSEAGSAPCRQNDGVRRISRVKTSSRPTSMPITASHLTTAFTDANVVVTSPRPGPSRFSDAVTAPNAEVRSRPAAIMPTASTSAVAM